MSESLETSSQPSHEAKNVPEHKRVQVDAADAAVIKNAARKLSSPNLIDRVRRKLYLEKRKTEDETPQFQEMSSATAAAGRFGYFTEGVNTPQSFKEIRRDRELERAYELITERAYHIFRGTEAFGEAVENRALGNALAETFDYITRIHTEGIHAEKAPPVKIGDEVVDIRVVADSMDLWVSTGREHKRLQVAVQGLKASPDAPFSPNIVPYPDESTAEALLPYRLEHPTEYQVREFNTIVRAIRKMENARKGIRDISVAEHAKLPLSVQEKRGETIDPANRARLIALTEMHAALQGKITATLKGSEKIWKPTVTKNMAVTDQSAGLGCMRIGFNNLLAKLKPGVHLNLEKDPSENLPLLNGIDLRRGGATIEGHPSATRTSTRGERLEDTVREALEDMKTSEGWKKLAVKSGKALANLGPNAASMLNPMTWIPLALSGAGKVWNVSKHLPGDMQEYQKRRKSNSVELKKIADDLRKSD